MRKLICSVQEGHVPRQRIPDLEIALKRAYADHFGAVPLVIWCEVPRGQGYTEGRLSDVSWLMVETADGLAQPRREAAMTALAREWSRVAGVPIERLMITLCDRKVFDTYLAANRNRLRPLSRPLYLLKLLLQIRASRQRDGYASIAANL